MNFTGPYSTVPYDEAPRYRPGRPIDIRKIQTSTSFPIDIDDVKLDLRVDSDDEDETIRRLMFGAAAFLERRTGIAFVPGRYEAHFDDWWSFGPWEFHRAPFRSLVELAWLDGNASPPTWSSVGLESVFVSPRSTSFLVAPHSTFSGPAVWAPFNGVRLRFDAGFDVPAESGVDPQSEADDGEELPIEDDASMLLMATIAHFYANRELFLADKLAQVEASAGNLLNSRRKFW